MWPQLRSSSVDKIVSRVLPPPDQEIRVSTLKPNKLEIRYHCNPPNIHSGVHRLALLVGRALTIVVRVPLVYAATPYVATHDYS